MYNFHKIISLTLHSSQPVSDILKVIEFKKFLLEQPVVIFIKVLFFNRNNIAAVNTLNERLNQVIQLLNSD